MSAGMLTGQQDWHCCWKDTSNLEEFEVKYGREKCKPTMVINLKWNCKIMA